MTIYLNEHEADLKNQLEEIGYTVTNDISSDFDAYIYSDSMSKLMESECKNAVFIINSEGKTTSEIDNILQNRLYSPIFSL